MTSTNIYWAVSLHNISSGRYNLHIRTDIRRHGGRSCCRLPDFWRHKGSFAVM